MDEMTRLRELRADAPTPDRAGLAPGRQRLANAIAGRNHRTRRLRSGWRIASLGAAAAITAAALIITQVVDTTAPRPPGPSAEARDVASLAYDPDLSSVAATLNEAADFLARQETPAEPRSDQWVYLREVGGTVSMRRILYSQPGPQPPTNIDRSALHTPQDTWERYDDKVRERTPNYAHPYTPRQLHRIATALPPAPEDLLEELRSRFPAVSGSALEGESEDAHSFRAVFTLLEESYAVPPDALARIYEALATVEGVEVIDHLVLAASGRKVIGVTRENVPAKSRLEIFISPTDYSYRGYREVTTRTHQMQGPDGRPTGQIQRRGNVLNDLARIDSAIVDADRERP